MNQLSPLPDSSPGERPSSSDLLPPVYQELRRVAAQKLAGEAAGHSLQATALVHEAWLRLGAADRKWENRAHFFAAAADTMRRVLVDHARRRNAQRRGGGWKRADAQEADQEADPQYDRQILDVHDALDQLAVEHPEKAQLVKLKFFGGLTSEEAAEVLGISMATATRHWAFARAWLLQCIGRGAEEMPLDSPAGKERDRREKQAPTLDAADASAATISGADREPACAHKIGASVASTDGGYGVSTPTDTKQL